MDFLLEFAVELVGELFLENGVEAAVDHRLPQWLRVLILSVTALVFAAVFGIIVIVGIAALSHTPLLSILLFALDAMLVLMAVHKVRKILRTLPRK